MKMTQRIAAIALVFLMLLTAGCSEGGETPEETPAATTAAPVETTAAPVETTVETEPDLANDSLNSLRQAMIETPQVFAVAYFGYHETLDSDLPVDPFEVMQEYAPALCEDMTFLLEIPEERIVGETGDLFCIVPLDPDATVAVSKGEWDDNSESHLYENNLYYSESGEPILLFCNNAGWEPDTQVYISGPSGEVFWYPQTDDNQCVAPLRNDNWDELFLDFSPYREMLLADYVSLKENTEWEAVLPTEEMLIGKSWDWSGYTKDGRDTRYKVTFREGTLDVTWNDGIDENAHEYRDAPWELTHEDGFAILTVDFGEFSGVLRYDLLYSQFYETLYVAQDVVHEKMNIGWEPLYRFLLPVTAPDPMEMLGVWELAWTEVEDDWSEAEPETEFVSILLDDEDVMRFSLDDMVFPHKSFYEKELEVYSGELFSGCGNELWMAYVAYMGPWDTVYSVTLLEDGMLLMRMYWEVDGMPMVAHKWYRRYIL